MKYLKALGPAACIAVLMTFGVSPTSATILTSPAGTEYSNTIKLQLKEGEAFFSNSFFGQIRCKESTIEGKVESQGAEVTAKVSLSTFDFGSCNGAFATLKPGSFEVHTDSASADGNGILTSSGTEITLELTGIHCILGTNNTNFGTVTGGSPAKLRARGVVIPRIGGRSGAFCGSSFSFSADYELVSPETFLVD